MKKNEETKIAIVFFFAKIHFFCQIEREEQLHFHVTAGTNTTQEE